MDKILDAHIAVSHLKSHVGFWMRIISNHVSHAFARKLERSGVTVAEWVVMREMYGESLTSPSVVAARIGMTRGAIALTAAGRRLVPTLATLADQNDEEFFHQLSRKERESLLSLLKKLVQVHGLEKLPTE